MASTPPPVGRSGTSRVTVIVPARHRAPVAVPGPLTAGAMQQVAAYALEQSRGDPAVAFQILQGYCSRRGLLRYKKHWHEALLLRCKPQACWTDRQGATPPHNALPFSTFGKRLLGRRRSPPTS